MTYSGDPSAGRTSVRFEELAEWGDLWDKYDASTDGPQPVPSWYHSIRHRNWWGSGATLSQLHALARDHGIPVARVPPADVLRELVQADDEHEAKLAVLLRHQERIRTACRHEVPSDSDGWLTDYPETARRVLAAWDDGHLLAAACLALAAAEDLMFIVSRVDRSKKYPGLTSAAAREPHPQWWPHEQVVLTPIESLFSRYFPEKNDPIPQNLSRHAVMHRLPLEHMNDGHCIVAIMLMVSLLAEHEWHMIEEQIDMWDEDGEEDGDGAAAD
ncbi:hypothetical protein ACF09E_21160 [Streptomyces sp. NPDC014891]|uniref:hypothetical protein n=1 Tax=Streptomyces sp. NPDC014891 TaxID=3364929 RepID=UPI0036FA7F41